MKSRVVVRLLISTLHFTQALRLVPANAFARATVPLRLVMRTGETAGSAAAANARPLAGPWRRTMYELYDWVSPLGAEGDVQNELVERATLEQQPCLGVALSSVAEEDEWPRDDFLTGATLEFSFGPPPLGPLSRPALELDEIPYADAGVGHTVWGSAMVLALFLRCPAGLALLAGAKGGEGGAARKPRVLEIGAGLGLPGRDLAARGAPRTHTPRLSFLSPLALWPRSISWALDPSPPWALALAHSLGPGPLALACFRHAPSPLEPEPRPDQASRASSRSVTRARSSSSSWPGPSTRRGARRRRRPRRAAASRRSR